MRVQSNAQGNVNVGRTISADGWSCAICGTWVPSDQQHSHVLPVQHPPQQLQWIPSQVNDPRILAVLERIAVALEALSAKGGV